MIDAARLRDLRRVAVHEHSHAAVARHFGGNVHVRIEPNPTGGDDELFFVGRCCYYADFLSLDEGYQRLVLLAGVVGECLDEDHEVESWQIVDWIENDVIVLSDTDARLGESFLEVEVIECLRVLRGAWTEIEREVGYEICVEKRRQAEGDDDA